MAFTFTAETQDLIKSALGTPEAQQELINAIQTIQGSQLVPNTVSLTTLAKDVIQQVPVTLTSSQILNLNTTPVTLVPAPGPGLSLVLGFIPYAGLSYGGATYVGANGININYGNGAAASSFTNGFLNSTSSKLATGTLGSIANVPSNSALVATIPTANPTVGNSSITFYIAYRVLPSPV